MLGPLNWNLAGKYHHSSQLCGKDLTLGSTFRAFKIITLFKNKSSQTHACRRTWLPRVLTVHSTVHNVLKTWPDSSTRGVAQWGLCWNQWSPTSLKPYSTQGSCYYWFPGSTALVWKPPGLLPFAVNGCCWAWEIQYPELCAAFTDVSGTTPTDSSRSRNSSHSLSHQSAPQRGRDGHRGYSCLWEAF